jgi:hypothetical protein
MFPLEFTIPSSRYLDKCCYCLRYKSEIFQLDFEIPSSRYSDNLSYRLRYSYIRPIAVFLILEKRHHFIFASSCLRPLWITVHLCPALTLDRNRLYQAAIRHGRDEVTLEALTCVQPAKPRCPWPSTSTGKYAGRDSCIDRQTAWPADGPDYGLWFHMSI